MRCQKKAPKVKVNGTIYILPKQFVVNLKGGQYATLTVALLLAPTQSAGTTSSKQPSPHRFRLADRGGRDPCDHHQRRHRPVVERAHDQGWPHRFGEKILADIKSQTDTIVNNIYFTDVAVQ